MNYTLSPCAIKNDSSNLPAQIELELIKGDAVHKLLKDNNFLESWDELYNDCPWSTVFQSKEFAVTWYTVYKLNYVPIIVRASFNSKLVGLITLNNLPENNYILASGLGTAEYQTWLALPEFGEVFIEKALTFLITSFPGYYINLYNLPPGTPLEWANKSFWKERTILKDLKRPLMDLSKPEVSKLFRKQQFREKTNRLNRLGDLKFERIINASHFASLLDDLIAQSDFRKGAKYNYYQFELDTYGKDFLLQLFEQGILHTTILTLNGQVISSIAAIYGNKWLHLAGFNTHSPLYARHSPGLINFIMLGQLLMEEGMHVFDLTPGGDAYKERLATSYDQVHELYISSTLKTKSKKMLLEPILRFVKSGIKISGHTPNQIKFKAFRIIERLMLIKQKPLLSTDTWFYIKNGMNGPVDVIKINPNQGRLLQNIEINSIHALLNYKSYQGIYTRWDFMDDAMKRFESGEELYSLSENGKLICCTWYSNPNEFNKNGVQYSEADIILSGIHCHINAESILSDFIKTVVAIKKDNQSQQGIYCIVDKRAYRIREKLNSMTQTKT